MSEVSLYCETTELHLRKGLIEMSTEGSIPPSIRDALDSKSGYVIVVTEKPGTGKTRFVHKVFREFEDSLLILSNAESTSVSDYNPIEYVPRMSSEKRSDWKIIWNW